MTRSRNPIGFTPWPVTLIIVSVYAFLFSIIIRNDRVVPPAPASSTLTRWPGVNLTQAWQDLQTLTRQHHPYDSRANDHVRSWLLARIQEILEANGIGHETTEVVAPPSRRDDGSNTTSRLATVFDDDRNNVLFQHSFGATPVYFESNNIVVYIRGSQDRPGEWWTNSSRKYSGPGCVLVNAHFDSVSTGYGATDTGVGVISVLQTIAHFTSPGNQPERGILALLNDAEELGLLGAEAFIHTPLADFARTFLNLEGTGGAGRALLFRATDVHVVRHYKHTSHPFGSILAQNSFESGISSSVTDYSVFADKKGMRGLDMAFIESRAKYHSSEDDIRHLTRDTLWHMLEATLSTVSSMCRSDSTESDGSGSSGDDGVWFDFLGISFAVIKLHDLFALSVTLLVVGPITFLILHLVLARIDKFFPMSSSVTVQGPGEESVHHVKLYGGRGFFRFPLAFSMATGATVLLALLVTKVNPYIIYSSRWAVWAMFMTAWICTAWFIFRLGDAVRPSAMARYYILVWIYAITWPLLVVNTVLMDQKHVGGGYFLVIYHVSVSVALLIAYIELFVLATKTAYAEGEVGGADEEPRRQPMAAEHDPRQSEGADERTSLLGSAPTFKRKNRDGRRSSGATSEIGGHHNEAAEMGIIRHEAYEGEQAWSASLPGWTWVLQFAVLAPVNLIIVGQLALLITAGVYQTSEDGNRPLPQYLLVAGLTVLLFLPVAPFMHRLKWQLPALLLAIFVGTAVYCLVAFPFSETSKLKVRFRQVVDLDTGSNLVSLTGNGGYVQEIAYSMPSSQLGTAVRCQESESRFGLTRCTWAGLTPRVVPQNYSFGDWIHVQTSRRGNGGDTIDLAIRGVNSRRCWLFFDSPVRRVVINGMHEHSVADEDWKYDDVRESSSSIRLISRSWEHNGFNISASGFDLEAPEDKISGHVECSWDDINDRQIPAYDEVLSYSPVWSLATASASTLPLLTAIKRFAI